MKKIILGIAVFLLCVGVLFAAWKNSGWSPPGTQTATTTATRHDLGNDWVYSVSFYNNGTSTVYAAVNMTSADFTTAMATTSCVPIPSSNSFTFARNENVKIRDFSYITLVGSSEVIIGTY